VWLSPNKGFIGIFQSASARASVIVIIAAITRFSSRSANPGGLTKSSGNSIFFEVFYFRILFIVSLCLYSFFLLFIARILRFAESDHFACLSACAFHHRILMESLAADWGVAMASLTTSTLSCKVSIFFLFYYLWHWFASLTFSSYSKSVSR